MRVINSLLIAAILCSGIQAEDRTYQWQGKEYVTDKEVEIKDGVLVFKGTNTPVPAKTPDKAKPVCVT